MDTRSILAEQIKAGRLKPHHLLSAVKPNDQVEIGGKFASVRKVNPKRYEVFVGDVGSEKDAKLVDTLDSPASAKLAFIDAMVGLVQ